MKFTDAELTVFEVLHVFSTQVFKQKLVGMNHTTVDGFTMSMVLHSKLPGYSVVMNHMLKMQWLVFVVDSNYPNGRWGINTLCTCGRCNTYTPRRVAQKNVTPSLEGFTAAFFKGMRGEQPYIALPAKVDEKRYAKGRQSSKFTTPQHAARVWNEAVSGIQREEEKKRQRLLKLMDRVTLELAEMS